MYDIILVSHSKRIRKFIDQFFDNFDINKRFMNCAILKLYNDDNNFVNIKLIYKGDLDPSENRARDIYYDIDEFNSFNYKTKKLVMPNNVNIYLIRHAQGYHNLNNTLIKKIKSLNNNHILKDPQLTEKGKIQAKNTGLFLKNIINNNILCFCSILLRTRETISLILNQFDFNKIKFNKEIYVLPGAHEITNFIIPELFIINNGQCVNKYSNRILYNCDFIINDINIFKFNWNYYSYIKKNNIKFSNMIYEIYLLISFNKYNETFTDNLRKKLIKIKY
jgi:hypothetical protein